MIILQKKDEQEQENTFVQHMTQDGWWKDDIQRMQKDKRIIVSGADVIREYGQRLICPKCEKGAYRHGARDRARCNCCGWEGRSITIDEYMTERLYRR